jgi:hypothetical protein
MTSEPRKRATRWRRRRIRWLVSCPGWWWSRGRWQTEVSEPPYSSRSMHLTLKAARRSARALLRAGSETAEMVCIYKDGRSRLFLAKASDRV